MNARSTTAVAGLIGALTALAVSPTEARAQATTSKQIEEIVVTARRHDEDLQTTPVSVISLSSEQLDAHSITNMRDLQRLVPNLTLGPQQNVGEGSSNIFIRGIGQEDFIAGAEPGVALYLDGVYIATTRGTIADLVDIERIEVLRGPQGTLYGRNSVGGAIQILSVKPGPALRSEGRVTLGSFGRREVRTTVNAPIGANLFARVSALAAERDGYMRRLMPPGAAAGLPNLDLRPEGANHTVAGRLQVRWLASERLTADIALDVSRKRGTQSAHRLERVDAAASGFLALNRLIQLGRLSGPQLSDAILPDGFFETHASGNNLLAIDGWGGAATLSRSTGNGLIKLVIAHRELDTHFSNDNDGLWYDISGTEFIDDHRQTSLEAQNNVALGPVELTSGLFALFNRSRSYPVANIASNGTLYTCGCYYPAQARPQLFSARRNLGDQSYAGYAQADVRLAPRLSATIGARYSYERKSAKSQAILNDAETLMPTETILGNGVAKDGWSSFTYRFGAEFQTTPDLMIYGSLAKGYKSGGFNVRVVSGVPNLGLTPYKPETARTIEIGMRSTWFHDRLRVNATFFHSIYQDLQLRQQKIIAGITTSQVDNAGKARIRGAEFEIEAVPLPRLKVRGAYGYIEPRYLDVGNVPGLTLDSQFQRTPRHSGNASISYTVPAFDGLLALNGDYAFRSREQFQIVSSPFDQAAYGLVGSRITWRRGDGDWAVSLFATNLTGEEYRTAGRGSVTIVGMPRQFGVEVKVNFQPEAGRKRH